MLVPYVCAVFGPSSFHPTNSIGALFPHPEIRQNGPMMRSLSPTLIGSPRVAPPTRRDLASDTKYPPFSIEKHCMLPPTLYRSFTSFSRFSSSSPYTSTTSHNAALLVSLPDLCNPIRAAFCLSFPHSFLARNAALLKPLGLQGRSRED